MGFLSKLFGKSSADAGDQPQEEERFQDKAVAKLYKKLTNKYHQTQERKRVIRLLADIGSDEAITALLGRFTFVTEGSIVDEDEKDLAYSVVMGFGERAIGPLTQFVLDEVAIYWPLQALVEIAGEDTAIKTLFAALESIHDRFERSMDRMQNLTSSLRDFNRPDVMHKLIELSKDESEEIRFLAVDGLAEFDTDQLAVDAMLERLLDDEETVRVKKYVLDKLMERRWNVKRFKKELSEKIPSEFFIDDTGIVQRR